MTDTPRAIAMTPADNVAIVANDFGLPEGAVLPGGLVLRERIPQGHKIALRDIPRGAEVRRYDVVIGYAAQDLPAGSWVNEHRIDMPRPPAPPGCPSVPTSAIPGRP